MGIAISAHVNLAITLRQAAPIRLLLTNVKASFSLGTLKKRVKRMKERYNLSQVQDQSEDRDCPRSLLAPFQRRLKLRDCDRFGQEAKHPALRGS